MNYRPLNCKTVKLITIFSDPCSAKNLI